MRRFAAVLAALGLVACDARDSGPRSLVGDTWAPGAHVLAKDTIVLWQRLPQPNGTTRLRTYTIDPAGGVQRLEESERGEIVADADVETAARPRGEERSRFSLDRRSLEAIWKQAALLRPPALDPEVATGGYAGEAFPHGCRRIGGQAPDAGVNFLNDAGWGMFVLQRGCTGGEAEAARGALNAMLAVLESRVTAATPALPAR